jgi:hypothetical protein
MVRISIGAVLFAATLATGSSACGGGQTGASRFPPGEPIQLIAEPAHLGNNRAGSQNFPSGPATAARLCSLVSLPTAIDANLQVLNVKNTETLSDQVTVNGRPFPLGIALERDLREVSPNSTALSPVFFVHLDAGPSEICLVAGLRSNGDVDDFEVEKMTLWVQGIDSRLVQVRMGLGLGTPPPSEPPSMPWGQSQGYPYRRP